MLSIFGGGRCGLSKIIARAARTQTCQYDQKQQDRNTEINIGAIEVPMVEQPLPAGTLGFQPFARFGRGRPRGRGGLSRCNLIGDDADLMSSVEGFRLDIDYGFRCGGRLGGFGRTQFDRAFVGEIQLMLLLGLLHVPHRSPLTLDIVDAGGAGGATNSAI